MWALGGVALMVLCSATAEAAPDAPLDAAEPSTAMLIKPLPRRKLAAPIPPGRPVELAVEIPPAPWDVAPPVAMSRAPTVAAEATAPVAEAAAPADVPVVSVAEAEAVAARSVAVAIVPPLRPAFAEARTDLAAAAPGVEVAVPLPPEAPDRAALEIAAERSAPARVATLPPRRPALAAELDPVETASLPEPQAAAPQPAPAQQPFLSLFAPFPQVAALPVEATTSPVFGGSGSLQQRIAYHAKLNDVPEALVHRVIVRESRYNPRAVGRGGALGLMQIKHATARGLGYGGPAAGLLEAETNLTYAVKYLAGAYRVAGGDFDGAVRNYARGYYYAAKRQGLVRTADLGRRLKRLREANARDLATEATGAATLQR